MRIPASCLLLIVLCCVGATQGSSLPPSAWMQRLHLEQPAARVLVKRSPQYHRPLARSGLPCHTTGPFATCPFPHLPALCRGLSGPINCVDTHFIDVNI